MKRRNGGIAALFVCVAALPALLAPAAEAEWLPPVEISASSANVARPHVALDSAGNATAVWDRWDGTATVVETAFRPAGSPWGEPEVISPPDSMSPKIVVDRNGVLTAAWERRTSVNHFAIETVSRPPGAEWGEPVEVTGFQQGFNPEPWLAVDWEGNTTVVWTQAEKIMSSFRSFAHEWGEPIPLSPGESFTPQTAMDARGDATAVWMHHDEGGHYVVESAYRPEQGEWGEPTLVSEPGEEGGNPQVAVDGQGDSLVVWRGEDEGKEFVRAAYRPADGEWSEPVNVSNEGEEVHALQAAVDPAGNAIVAWGGNMRNFGEFDVAHTAFKPAGGDWEAPVAISEGDANAYPNDLVFDQSGNAAIAWIRWDGIDWRLQAAYRPADGDWEAPVYLSDEGKDAMDATVVLDAPGSATVADGDATAIWVSGTPVACPGPDIEPCNTYVVEAAGYDPDGLPEVEVEAPAEGEVGEPIEISTPTEDLFSPEIDFGDGEKADGTEATHVYDEPGEYLVKAAGAEELGYFGFAQETITIRAAGTGEEPEPESEPQPEPETGGESGGSTKSGDPPVAADPAPEPGPSQACLAARAARDAAAARLRRTRAKLETATDAKALRRLLKIAENRKAALRRARAKILTAC